MQFSNKVYHNVTHQSMIQGFNIVLVKEKRKLYTKIAHCSWFPNRLRIFIPPMRSVAKVYQIFTVFHWVPKAYFLERITNIVHATSNSWFTVYMS